MQVDDVTEKKKKHKLGHIYINTFKWFLNEIVINTDVMANHRCQMFVINYCSHNLHLHLFHIHTNSLKTININNGDGLNQNQQYSITINEWCPMFIYHLNRNNTNDSDTDKQYMIYIPAITNDPDLNKCYITIYSETHYTISNLTPTAQEILEMQQLSKADLTCQDTHCKYKIKIVNIYNINIYAHLTLFIYLIFTFLTYIWIAYSYQIQHLEYFFILMIFQKFMVWESVLIHELAHAYGAYLYNGKTDKIILWPFGGITFSILDGRNACKHNRLVHVLLGPLTHLIHVILFGVALSFFNFKGGLTILPSYPENYYYVMGSYILLPMDNISTFVCNILLISFNLHFWALVYNLFVPCFPLDGSKVFIELLYCFPLNDKVKAILYFMANISVIIFLVVVSKLYLYDCYFPIFLQTIPLILLSLYQCTFTIILFYKNRERNHPLFKHSQLFH